jgi:hypothetical protein
MEKLFTRQNQIEIESEASRNLEEYLGGLIINGNSTEMSIITVSKEKQLIFVEGNADTGFGHLRDRHGYFSFKNYWITAQNENFKLDNPSKFHPKMMPIIDFIKISDTIFNSENKNITKNNHPDIFDKYTGYFNYTETQNEKYHLLTYKDTKIVHTLFPDKKKYNNKQVCKFGKGIVSTIFKFPIGHCDLIVPYEDAFGKPKYSILLRKFCSEKIERAFIQRHDINGIVVEQYILAYKSFDEFEKFEQDLLDEFQYGDLTYFETQINQIDKQLNE